ncbi:MAG UNVERIFIED_CONTAM: MFS transporter [Anaerolineae bacterium]
MDAFALYLLLQGLLWFLGSLTVGLSQLYRIREVGLSPLELVLVGTALEVSILLFEVPTGVLADVYSRRLSVIIGHVVVGLGMLLMGLVPTFWTMLLSSALWGLGYTFQSGAESAWLVDEVGQERAERAFLRSRQVGVIFGLVGMALTAYLANIALALPIIIGAVGYFILAILLIVVMPEKGFTPRPSEERATWQAHFDTLKEGLRAVRQRPPLRSLLVIGLIRGIF